MLIFNRTKFQIVRIAREGRGRMEKLRWGILGTGNIVAKAGPGIRQSSNGELVGIAGRNEENSRLAAEKYGAQQAYSGYEELIQDKEIDAVYIALLNHLHCEWAIKAIEAGKHVLVEKPFAMNAQQALRIREAAQKHRVEAVEAFVWRHQPAHQAVKDMINNGLIGRPVQFFGHFSFKANPKSTRLVKEWGGGSLYDIGCYPISWSRFIMEGEPLSVDSRMILDPVSGVDMRFAGTLHYSDGRAAQISSAMDMANGSFYEVLGTNGRIKVDYHVTAASLTIDVSSGGEMKQWTSDRIEPFRLQAESFAASVLSGKSVTYGIEDAIRQAQIIDALFEADRTQERAAIPR